MSKNPPKEVINAGSIVTINYTILPNLLNGKIVKQTNKKNNKT